MCRCDNMLVGFGRHADSELALIWHNLVRQLGRTPNTTNTWLLSAGPTGTALTKLDSCTEPEEPHASHLEASLAFSRAEQQLMAHTAGQLQDMGTHIGQHKHC